MIPDPKANTDSWANLGRVLRQLADELPVGMLILDGEGEVSEANACAHQVLEGPGGDAVRDTMKAMCQRAAMVDAPVEAVLSIGAGGEVRLLLGQGEEPGHFAAFVERSGIDRLRAQNQALRAMLSSTTRDGPSDDAIVECIATLAGSLAGCHLSIYRRSEERLERLAWSGVAPDERLLQDGYDLEPSAVATPVRVALGGNPIHVARAGEDPEGRARSMLVLPVHAREATIGVLVVVGPTELLGTGELRLLLGLVDAVGALLDRGRQDAQLQNAARTAASREALAGLGQLAAGVAHEINSPLAYVNANLSCIPVRLKRLEEALGASGPSDLTAAGKLVTELREITDDCLDGVNRISEIALALKGTVRQGDELTAFDPGPAIDNALTIFRGANKHECRLELEIPELPPVRGVPGRLSQVVINMLENGLDAMGGSGRLRVSALADLDEVRIEITDDGGGIPESVQDRIFEPFFTTKSSDRGTGLGLYICKGIVEQMGGAIRFRSTAAGTTFSVSLPRA